MKWNDKNKCEMFSMCRHFHSSISFLDVQIQSNDCSKLQPKEMGSMLKRERERTHTNVHVSIEKSREKITYFGIGPTQQHLCVAISRAIWINEKPIWKSNHVIFIGARKCLPQNSIAGSCLRARSCMYVCVWLTSKYFAHQPNRCTEYFFSLLFCLLILYVRFDVEMELFSRMCHCFISIFFSRFKCVSFFLFYFTSSLWFFVRPIEIYGKGKRPVAFMRCLLLSLA